MENSRTAPTAPDGPALADSGCERRLAAILENAREGIVVAAEGRLVSVNPFMEELTGHSAAELLSRPFAAFIHADDRQTVLESHTRRLSGEKATPTITFRILAKDGEIRWVRASSARIEWEGRTAGLSLLADITAEKRAQAALAELIANQDAVIASRTRSLREINLRLQQEIEGHEQARQSLERSNERLRQEIEEHERTARKLKAAREKATQAARAKSVFLANMSHEIRTPLTVILGMADMALRPDSQEHIDQVRALEMIREAGTSLRSLLGDLLDLSRVEAGRLDLESIPFAPRRVLAAVLDGHGLLAKRQGVRLSGEVSPAVPEVVRGDPGRLAQVLRNLVSNALKFTPNGSVTVTVRPLARKPRPDDTSVTLQCSVRDTGIGIAPEKQQAIFQNFRQADDSISRKFGGTGLGLAICRRLVGLMNGRIRVKSIPGQGSDFIFTARFERGDPADCPTCPPPEAPAPDTPPLDILLAEDSDLGAEMIMAFLTPRGHHVTRATDGHEALSALGMRHFDLVLMDIQMPGMDGLTAITAIRNGEVAKLDPAIPIVALTAHGSAKDRERILAAGATDYMAKPVSLDALLETLDRLAVPHATPKVSGPPLPTDTPRDASLEAGKAAALVNLGNDAALYERLLAVFARDTPADRAQLRQALDDNDLSAIVLKAHAIKGNAGVIGALDVQQRALALEQAGRHASPDDLPALAETLFAAIDRAMAALKAQGIEPASLLRAEEN